MQILVVESAGSPEYVASANSMGQMVATASRALAPIFASSLFALSTGKHLLGGYLVYAVQLSILAVAGGSTLLLPR
jgi:hypothetical protein